MLAGTANAALAVGVARRLGVELTACDVDRFPDGELSVTIHESVRGRSIFVVQPTAPPVNENLMELIAFADACRRASAARITAIIPYYGYARSDRRNSRRQPITASVVAVLLESAGIDHVVVVDPHTSQIEGFFRIPVDSLTAVPLLAQALASVRTDASVIVSPDAGRVKMATDYANQLNLPLIVLHKQRVTGEETRVTHVVGTVRDRHCILIDDMIATGGTLVESARALSVEGARAGIDVAATHGLFLGDALRRLHAAGIREIVTTDSVRPAEHAGVRRVSLADTLAEVIKHELSGRTRCA